MPTDVRCQNCEFVIDPASIDRQRELASCSNCGRLMDLRKARGPTPNATEAPGKARARPSVELPVGMSVETGARLVIRRRWLRTKHWFLLMLFAAAGIYVAHLWSTVGTSAWLIVGTLFLSSWYYNLVAMFVNSTVVTADAEVVLARHGPLPSLFARKRAVCRAEIEQQCSELSGSVAFEGCH